MGTKNMSDINQNDLINPLVRDLLKEKRSDRRWKNIRFFLGFCLLAYAIFNIFNLTDNAPTPNGKDGSYVAFVRLDGMIAPGREFSAEEVIPTLRDAFKDKHAAGVVIDINSPGGTPVQASIIHDAIIALKNKYHKKVIIVGEDFLTSGAYFVAVAADKIYVNPNTLTGSIGVIMKGFGFVDLMKKAGVDRRVYTAGTQKDRLDPFLPQNPEDLKKIQEVMGEVHKNFVDAVMEGRKGKLKADPETLFNGDFWSGISAMNLGLVDGLGNLIDVMDKEFKTTRYKEYGGTPMLFKTLTGQFNSSLDSFLYRFS
jgi:protease-4